MRRCLRILNLEDDAATLFSIRDASNKEDIKRRRSIEHTIRNAYRGAIGRCLQSLAFDAMMAREEVIPQPATHTCLWIYEELEYQRWISNEKLLLWIKGHPGSGKSVLMKSIFKRRQEELDGLSTILLRFFFNARGSSMERSSEALYRTLLRSLMLESDVLSCEITTSYLLKESRGRNIQWKTSEIADMFHEKIESYQAKDIEILIDALDECSYTEVLEVVRRFERSIDVPRNGTTLKICWSSRFYPNISLASVHGVELVINIHNTKDIWKHVWSILPMKSSRKLQDIGETIISRAQGTFLWASLVTSKLKKAYDAGSGLEELEALLADTPNGLTELFLEIFNRPQFQEKQRQDLRKVASLILGGVRAFTIDELYAALYLTVSDLPVSFSAVTLESDRAHQFKKKLTHISGGLIEVVVIDSRKESRSRSTARHWRRRIPWASRTRVQVIHESVREFFLTEGLTILGARSKESFLAECHLRILCAGFNGLDILHKELPVMAPLDDSMTASQRDFMLRSLVPERAWKTPQLPFLLDYARNHIFTHFDHFYRSYDKYDEDHSSSQPPSTDMCRRALFAYLRLACFEIFHHGGLEKSMNEQLRVISKYHAAYGAEPATFAGDLDFPNRLLAASEFLRRRGIFLFEETTCLNHESSDLVYFMAVFSARFSQQSSHSLTKINIHPESDSQGSEIDISSATMSELGTSGVAPDFFLFGLSIGVPTSIAPRLAIPGRLASSNPRNIDREKVVFPVYVSHWQVVSDLDTGTYGLSFAYSQSVQEGHLTFSDPSELCCRLFHQASHSNYKFIQEGSCVLSWTVLDYEPDRETLFEEIKRPDQWAVVVGSSKS